MTIAFQYRKLIFKRPAGTSRGVLKNKPSWFVRVMHNGQTGYGEISIIPALSPERESDIVHKLIELSNGINQNIIIGKDDLKNFPAVKFGLETALLDLKSDKPFIPFPGQFADGKKKIAINGLIWMGDKEFMLQQIEDKLASGFHCIKLKIGAIDFESECELLQHIRNHYSAEKIEIRVDANGAFAPDEALKKLDRLSSFDIHSIEQPIRQGQWRTMARLCRESPVPIALDEELIGISDKNQKRALLETIRPQYIILKPSLIGGFSSADEWIGLAQSMNTGWWATSALEANIGLNAIAQWVAGKNNPMPQGLGTGQLFENNIDSPLRIENGTIFSDTSLHWNIDRLFEE